MQADGLAFPLAVEAEILVGVGYTLAPPLGVQDVYYGYFNAAIFFKNGFGKTDVEAAEGTGFKQGIFGGGVAPAAELCFVAFAESKTIVKVPGKTKAARAYVTIWKAAFKMGVKTTHVGVAVPPSGNWYGQANIKITCILATHVLGLCKALFAYLLCNGLAVIFGVAVAIGYIKCIPVRVA